jgi:hypothetical protein
LLTSSSHGLETGDKVQLTGTDLPVGVTEDVVYYVHKIDGNTFKLSLDATSDVIAYSDSGSGTLKWFNDNRLGFINKNFLEQDDDTAQIEIPNAWYDTTAGSNPDKDDTVSYFQLRNHGLLDGMKITLSGIGSHTGKPDDEAGYIVSATANTFRYAGGTDNKPEKFENNESAQLFVQYYPKETTIRVTASQNLFKSTDTGRLIRFSPFKRDTIYWVYGVITYVDEKTADILLKHDCPISQSVGLTAWKLGSWYENNYPYHVNIFQQRMVFARNATSPQTVWLSETGLFEHFAPSEQLGSATGEKSATGAEIVGDQILATNGLTFTFDSGTIDEIQWLVAQEKLLAGSTGGVYTVYGSEQDLTLSPFNFTIKREGTQPAQTGSNAVPYDSNALYIQGTGKKVRLITFGDASLGAKSVDVTNRATDILAESAKQVVETDIPNFVSWFRMGDGTVVGLTYIPQLEIVAWHTHELGGDYTYTSTRGGDPTSHLTSDKTHAVVLDMCTIPSSTRDQIWFLVRRTVEVADSDESKTHRIIETIEVMEDWMSTESISDSKYLDGHVSASSATDFSAGALSHLQAESVDILGDGSVIDSQTVHSDGTLTTAIASTQGTLIAGKGYLSRLISLPIARGPTGNVRIGNKKRVHRGWVKLFRTPNFKYAIYTSDFTDSDLAESVTRTIADLYGTAPTMASDTRELIPLSQGFTDGQFLVQQTDPLPLNILALELDYETNDN